MLIADDLDNSATSQQLQDLVIKMNMRAVASKTDTRKVWSNRRPCSVYAYNVEGG